MFSTWIPNVIMLPSILGILSIYVTFINNVTQIFCKTKIILLFATLYTVTKVLYPLLWICATSLMLTLCFGLIFKCFVFSVNLVKERTESYAKSGRDF